MLAGNNKIYIPTLLTLLRIALTPFLALDIISQEWGRAFLLFTIAALTDFLDGFLARRWKQETLIGALLDPLADKILIIACYCALFYSSATVLKIPLWFIIGITTKEAILVIGTLYGIATHKKLITKPSLLGKVAMIVQTCFIALLCFYRFAYDKHPLPFFSFWLYGIMSITLLSLIDYMYINYRKITL